MYNVTYVKSFDEKYNRNSIKLNRYKNNRKNELLDMFIANMFICGV